MKIFGKSKVLPLASVLTGLALLGGCGTAITSSNNPSHERARLWWDYKSLPVKFIGTVPGQTDATLAALYPTQDGVASADSRRIVMYLNAVRLPAKDVLCSAETEFAQGGPKGGLTQVTAAMCDGSKEITRTSGQIATDGASARWLTIGFDNIRDQLYTALTPGANHPYMGN